MLNKKELLEHVIEQLQNVDIENLESIGIKNDTFDDGYRLYISLYFDNDLQVKHDRHKDINQEQDEE